jgi:hypothetical protein
MIERASGERRPFGVDWIDLRRVASLADAPGGLGMAPAPGRAGDVRGAVQGMREDDAVDALLLLLNDAELAQLGLIDLPRAAADAGVHVLRYPIPDFAVPEDPLTFGELLDDVLGRIRAGERVVVACRGGFGRTGTVVGCLLRQADVGPEEAVALVRATRPGAIEREEQQAFVEAWNAL